MKESWPAMIVSITMHACLIPLVLAASLAFDNRPGKVIEIDLSLVDRLPEHSASEIKKQAIANGSKVRGGGMPGKMKNRAPSTRNDTTVMPAREEASPPPVPTVVTASDPQSETVVPGVEAASAGSLGAGGSLEGYGGGTGGTGHGQGGSGGGSGGGQGGGQGSGAGLAAGGRDCNYIRDAVMKNIKYPEEAIRLGIEGRVVVSFIVLENGATSKINVVSGSGYRLLDESAKGAVAMTRIRRKVPYRVVVHLPVTYKLQG